MAVNNGSSGGGQDPAQLAAAYRGVAPGWYQDAGDPTLARYWDGTSLSAHTQPVAPPPAPTMAPTAVSAPSASTLPNASVIAAPGASPGPSQAKGPETEERAQPVRMSRLDWMSVTFARGMTRLLGRTN